MRYFAIGLILLFLAPPCMAEQENVTIGPYNVSFDLGRPENSYAIELLAPKQKESLSGLLSMEYKINLTDTSDRVGFIKIMEYEDRLIIPPQSELIQDLRDVLPPSLSDTESVSRIIDGHPGAAASGRTYFSNTYSYVATYYLSPFETVFIASQYPWEEGTLALLRSIHIERNSTAST